MTSYQRLLPFQDLLLHYQKVERVVYVPGLNRWENDVEHSYMIAMLAWYIIARDGLALNVDKVLKYALVHDLVEVYAGDTYLYDEEAVKTKHEREEKAQKRIAEEFPEFEELHDIIAAYEKQEDQESKYIRALDKLHPMLMIYADSGRLWGEKKITIRMIIESKQQYIDASPEIKPYFESFIEHLKTRSDMIERA